MSNMNALQRMGLPSLQAYLRGAWQLTRDMKHADGSTMGVVNQAVANFTDHKSTSEHEEMLYREEGMVNFTPGVEGKEMSFYREYMYSFTSPTSADVSFYQPGNQSEHLKFFHTLNISGTGVGTTTEHLCIDDLYNATIEISSEQAFRATWTVVGPHKNYQIFSQYTRQ